VKSPFFITFLSVAFPIHGPSQTRHQESGGLQRYGSIPRDELLGAARRMLKRSNGGLMVVETWFIMVAIMVNNG